LLSFTSRPIHTGKLRIFNTQSPLCPGCRRWAEMRGWTTDSHQRRSRPPAPRPVKRRSSQHQPATRQVRSRTTHPKKNLCYFTQKKNKKQKKIHIQLIKDRKNIFSIQKNPLGYRYRYQHVQGDWCSDKRPPSAHRKNHKILIAEKTNHSEATGTSTEACGSGSVARFIETDADSSAIEHLRCVSRHEQ
jgi:hypothetical protein